jgi:hypothetical protein
MATSGSCWEEAARLLEALMMGDRMMRQGGGALAAAPN